MNTNNVIAVTESVATAGAIIFWRMSGSVDVEALTAAVSAVDPKLAPTPPGARAALQRAVNELKTEDLFPRRIRGGWALVRERNRDNGGDLKHQVETKAVLDRTDDNVQLKITGPNDAKLAREFEAALATFTTSDSSLWLGRVVMPWLDAVSLREGGGMYFVPQRRIERLQSLRSVLHGVTEHRIYTIPALHSKDAVEAVLDAVIAEAQQTMAALLRGTDEAGIRNLDTRKGQLAALNEKLARYTDLLGPRLDVLDDELAETEKALALATLQAIGRKDAAKAEK